MPRFPILHLHCEQHFHMGTVVKLDAAQRFECELTEGAVDV